MISEEEFYAQAPENISQHDKTSHDEHARRLARLSWELQQVYKNLMKLITGPWFFSHYLTSVVSQRKELAAMYKELEKQKELVAQDNEKKTNLRDSLKPRLEALLKVTLDENKASLNLITLNNSPCQSTKPLQEALNMNYEDDWKVQKIANLLPRPLYLVYANLCAYAEACGKTFLKS